MTESPALTIRGLHNDDWESLFPLWHINEVLANSVDLPYMSEETFRERFGSSPANQQTLIAEIGLPSGRKRVIGLGWLQVFQQRRRHSGSISMVMYPEYRASADEEVLLCALIDLADNWLGLRRLEMTVYVDDQHRIALLQRHGFEIEATMRRYALRGGAACDAHIMARLRTRHESPKSSNREEAS